MLTYGNTNTYTDVEGKVHYKYMERLQIQIRTGESSLQIHGTVAAGKREKSFAGLGGCSQICATQSSSY